MYVFNVPFPCYSHREYQTSENSCLYTVVELFCFSATHIITLDSYNDLNIPLTGDSYLCSRVVSVKRYNSKSLDLWYNFKEMQVIMMEKFLH